MASPDAQFVLLSKGNPLVRRGDTTGQVALVGWHEVADAVLQTVRLVAPDADAVFGPAVYGLEHNGTNAKHWSRSTQCILAPALSLAYLGVHETQEAPRSCTFTEDGKERTLVVPCGAPYFALSLSCRPPGTSPDTILPCEALLSQWTADGGAFEPLDMKTVVLTSALHRDDAGLVANARTLLDWSERYAFCAACGSRQYSVWGGHKRGCASVLRRLARMPNAFVDAVHAGPVPASLCPSVESVQNYSYPRSDPVIIVGIVSADGEHILVGRQKAWPKGFYSCVAYVSRSYAADLSSRASRSRRRCGARRWRRQASSSTRWHTTGTSRHLPSSQPWPFPANLILGAYGTATKESAQLRLDLDPELEDAFFATRADIKAAVEAAEQQRGAKGDGPERNGQRYLYAALLTQPPAAVGHGACPARRLGAWRGDPAWPYVAPHINPRSHHPRFSRRTMLGSTVHLARSAWKGVLAMLTAGPFFVPFPNLQQALKNNTPIRTNARSCTILPNFVGYVHAANPRLKFLIHNGKHHIPVSVTEEMVGHKLGEFATTRKRFSYRYVWLGG